MQASISIRKGKKLCFFELSVKATWEGALGVGLFHGAAQVSLRGC